MKNELVKAYIGLGSNLGDRKGILEDAVSDLDNLPETKVTRRSTWMENPAVAIEGGYDFLNGAVEIETRLTPRELLEHLFEIERRYGRCREQDEGGQGYRNRTLDLDLLLYGKESIEEPGLIVPHPRMLERDFVLVPLKELGRVPPF